MNEECKGRFVQFPLSLLAASGDFRMVMDDATSYAIQRLIKSLDPDDYRSGEALIEHARRVVGFSGGNLERIASEALRAHHFAAAFEQTEHKPATVRIPTDYAFEMRNGEWSESESRVFIAVASAIGCKPYARLGWEHAALRAAGYVRPKRTTPPLQLMTRNQVEYALRRLEDRNLLTHFTLNRGVRYWAFPNVCSREEIARFVLRKRAKRETDPELQARILAEIKEGKDSSR